jgi:hypothetical protein
MTDIYANVDDADPDVLANLGPLQPLAGIWAGDEGFHHTDRNTLSKVSG